MRLDKFLKVSRIIKRRTVANEACDSEHVEGNGKRAKASYDVKEGDVIAVTYGDRTLKFRVLDVKEPAREGRRLLPVRGHRGLTAASLRIFLTR